MKKIWSPDEAELFRAGNKDFFQLIFKEYKPPVYNYCHRFLNGEEGAEDVAVETMASLWENKHMITSLEHMERWLYFTAKNKCINLLSGRKQHSPLRVADSLADEGEDQLMRLENKVRALAERAFLEEEIPLLPKKCREIIRLHYLEGMSADDIATLLGVARKTVYGQWANGRKKLKEAYLKKKK